MPAGRPPLNAPLSIDVSQPSLPHHLRMLCVGPQEPPWPLLALRLETAGCDDAKFEWQSTATGALTVLRKLSFDAIVIQDDPEVLRLIEAIRASGTEDPIAVILSQSDDDRLVDLEQFDCEVLISPYGWQSRALVSTVRRSVTRGDIRRDVASLQSAAQRGRLRERDEAEAQLSQLQHLITGKPLADPDTQKESLLETCPGRTDIPAQIDQYYRELLRTYVMMGSGNLADEMHKLAELLSLSGVSMREALSLHLKHVESLLGGLGNRSSRHIMARADLLALELMIQLGECYRSKSRFRGLGDNGIDLLHAQMLLQPASDSRSS